LVLGAQGSSQSTCSQPETGRPFISIGRASVVPEETVGACGIDPHHEAALVACRDCHRAGDEEGE